MSDVILRQVRATHGGLALKLIDQDILSGGAGGWQINDVRHAKQSTSWNGTPALIYTLPLRLDGMGNDPSRHVSVQPQVNHLWALANPGHSRGQVQAPVRLRALGRVRTPPSKQWVITNLTENAIVRTDHGTVIQYDVTVELTEFQAGHSPAKKAGHKKAAKKAKKKKAGGGGSSGGTNPLSWLNK